LSCAWPTSVASPCSSTWAASSGAAALPRSKAGAEEFWGGWRHEVIDCDARTIAHAGFGSIRAGGREGPVTGAQRPPAPLSTGSADEAVAKIVCDGWRPFAKVPVATSVEDAVKLGRPLIETGAEP